MNKLPETVTLPIAVDVHGHLRWPSPVNKSEDYESGTAAAAFGGYGLVEDMPNTEGAPTWSWQAADLKKNGIRYYSILPMAIAAGSQPETNNEGQLAEMARICALLKLYMGTTTGTQISEKMVVRDFEPATKAWHAAAPDKPIFVHRGNADPNEIISMIALENEHHVHFCHVTTVEEIRAIAKARMNDLPVTGGVCPHHLLESADAIKELGWFARMMPPLVGESDIEQLWYALKHNDIQIIETDHAPHSKTTKLKAEDKNPEGSAELDPYPFGVPGLQFALPRLFYESSLGKVSLETLVEKISTNPAKLLGIRITEDSKVEWRMEEFEITEDQILSKCGWDLAIGKRATGKVVNLVVGGRQIINNQRLVGRYPRAISSRGLEI